MKNFFIVSFFIVLATSVHARIHIDHDEEMERKKLSVLLLVDGTVRAVETQPIAVQSVYRQIQNDKHRHQKREESYELSQVLIEKRLKSDLKQNIRRIFNTSGLDEADPDWCDEKERQSLEKADSHIAANLSAHFKETFSRARSKAVEEQQADLIEVAKPQTPEDYVKVEKQSPDLNRVLLERSTKTFKEPIFSENSDYLSTKIDEIILEARRQYNEQRTIVGNSRGGGGLERTLGAIEKEIRKEIEQYRSSLEDPYKIFPSVEKSIRSRTQALALQKFETWSEALDFKIPDSQIRKAIEKDLAGHRKRSGSKELLLQYFLPEVERTTADAYTKTLSPEEKRRLKQFLEEQPPYYVQLEEVAERSLKGVGTVRDALGHEQFAKRFPELAEGTWKPDDETIQRRVNRDIVKDNQKIVQSFLSGTSVMEETQVLVEEAVHRLADKGDTALRQQMGRVAQYRNEVEQNPRRLFEAISTGEMETGAALKELIQRATADIEREWSAMPLSKEYPALFRIVKEQVRKEIKDLISIELVQRGKGRTGDSARVVRQTGKVPDPNKNGDGTKVKGEGQEHGFFEKSSQAAHGNKPGAGATGGKSGQQGSTGSYSVKKGKTSAIVVIDIEIENEKIVIATVQFDETDFFTLTFPLGRENSKKFQALMDPQLETYESRVKNWFMRIPSGSPLRFVYGVTRIFHARVPYGLVFELRERFRRAAKREDGRKLSLFWFDGIFSQRTPVHKNDIKRRSYRLMPGESP